MQRWKTTYKSAKKDVRLPTELLQFKNKILSFNFPTFMKLKHRRMQEREKFDNKYLKKNFCYSNSLNVKTREKQIDDACWVLNNILHSFLFIKFLLLSIQKIWWDKLGFVPIHSILIHSIFYIFWKQGI